MGGQFLASMALISNFQGEFIAIERFLLAFMTSS